MSESSSTHDRILAAAETVLRRYGVEKTNVVDIAKTLEISHAAIYKHFPSKKALLDAVAERWLEKVTAPLEAIAKDTKKSPTTRLIAWFENLRHAKQRKVLDDPELFRVYHRLAMDAGELASDHVISLVDQVATIIAAGIQKKEFSAKLEPREAAQACLQSMAPFHHPALLILSGTPPKEADARAVMALLLAGLRAGPAALPER